MRIWRSRVVWSSAHDWKSCNRHKRFEGSNPSFSATSEWTLLHSDFSLQKNQSHAPSFLLFRKKGCSARLFACKRTHNGSLSLPPFCEYRLRRKYLYGSALPCQSKLYACSDFCLQKSERGNVPLPFISGEKACSAYLFTFVIAFLRVVPAAQISLLLLFNIL